MDKNNFDQLGFPVNDNSDDFGTTRELNSIHDADPEDPSGIAPRDRFTEMNSADDPGSTRMMDSLTAPDEPEAAALCASQDDAHRDRLYLHPVHGRDRL